MASDQQYDLTPSEKQKILKRAELRQALKKEYLKQQYNPHRYMSGEPGYLFDPAIQRYLSMNATAAEFFRPTYKGFFQWFGCVLFPIGFFTCLFYHSRANYEEKLRNGEVAYKDRIFKFNN